MGMREQRISVRVQRTHTTNRLGESMRCLQKREIIRVFFTFPTNGTEQSQSAEIKSFCDLQIFYQAPSTECAEIKSVYWWCKVYSKRGARMTQLRRTERNAFRLDLISHDGSTLSAQGTFSIETVHQPIRNRTAISKDGWSYITQCMVQRVLAQEHVLGVKHWFPEWNEHEHVSICFNEMDWEFLNNGQKNAKEGVAQDVVMLDIMLKIT